jgi:SAM-dependent methyltransferase
MSEHAPLDPDRAEHDDRWHARLAGSAAHEELVRAHLGLPALMLVTGLVPWRGLEAVTSSLRLVPGETLLDLGCGRGGYGLEVARRARARLVGVDHSEEALRQAEANAAAAGEEAEFRLGDLAATGLDDDSVEAVMCLDSVQFSLRTVNTYAEVRRVLAPEGRVVVTAWEARDRDDEELPVALRTLDVAHGLELAGFVDVEREVCDEWSEVERGLWEEAVALDLPEVGAEGRRVLRTFDRVDRVMVTASAPS